MANKPLQFKHPSNDYVENISAPWLWCFLFGPVYFLFKGCIGMAFAHLIITACTAGLGWLFMPLVAKDTVTKHYLRKGWTHV